MWGFLPPAHDDEAAAVKAAWDSAYAKDPARAQAILAYLEKSGAQELAALQAHGAQLIASLQRQQANALTSFAAQAVYDLDKNRGLTPNEYGYRPGYAGTRAYAPKVTAEDAMKLPGYEAIARQFQERIIAAGEQNQLALDDAAAQNALQKEKTSIDLGIPLPAGQGGVADGQKAGTGEGLSAGVLAPQGPNPEEERMRREMDRRRRASQSFSGGGGGGGGNKADKYIQDSSDNNWATVHVSGQPTPLGDPYNPYGSYGGAEMLAHGGTTDLASVRERARQKHARRTKRPY